jgi:starch synthase
MLRARSHDLHGILNGIDVHEWDPRADPYLPAPYDASDLSGRRSARPSPASLRAAGSDHVSDAPLFGVVSRLAGQKGISLLLEGSTLLDRGAEVVVLGNGERWYADGLRALAAARPDGSAPSSASSRRSRTWWRPGRTSS